MQQALHSTQNVCQLIKLDWLNQTPICKKWHIYCWRNNIHVGRLGGIALTIFWPWGDRPHHSHGVGAYAYTSLRLIDPQLLNLVLIPPHHDKRGQEQTSRFRAARFEPGAGQIKARRLLFIHPADGGGEVADRAGADQRSAVVNQGSCARLPVPLSSSVRHVVTDART